MMLQLSTLMDIVSRIFTFKHRLWLNVHYKYHMSILEAICQKYKSPTCEAFKVLKESSLNWRLKKRFSKSFTPAFLYLTNVFSVLYCSHFDYLIIGLTYIVLFNSQLPFIVVDLLCYLLFHTYHNSLIIMVYITNAKQYLTLVETFCILVIFHLFVM